jgi:hypothetical protein
MGIIPSDSQPQVARALRTGASRICGSCPRSLALRAGGLPCGSGAPCACPRPAASFSRCGSQYPDRQVLAASVRPIDLRGPASRTTCRRSAVVLHDRLVPGKLHLTVLITCTKANLDMGGSSQRDALTDIAPQWPRSFASALARAATGPRCRAHKGLLAVPFARNYVVPAGARHRTDRVAWPTFASPARLRGIRPCSSAIAVLVSPAWHCSPARLSLPPTARPR